MGFLDRLLGREPRDAHDAGGHGTAAQQTGGYPTQYPPAGPAYGTSGAPSSAAPRDADQVAIDRYRYLLRTAPPDAVEQAHAEAFARLTPDQRRQVLEDLGSVVPPAERATSDAPQDLARMATRAEMRQPGTLERSFAGRGGAPGFGSMVGSSLLGTVAGVVIGSAVANALFGPAFGDPAQPVAEDGAAGDPGGDPGAGDSGAGDAGAVEAGGADPGADAGGFGGDGGFGDAGGFDDFGGFGEF